MTPPARRQHGLRVLLSAAAAALLVGCAASPPAPVAPPPPPPAVVPEPPPAPPPVAVAPPPPPEPEPAPPAEPLPRARLDPLDDSATTDLWQRVRDRFALGNLDSDLVRKWEQYYASRPDYVQRMAGRGSRYLFHIIEEVDRRGLPAELALLPFVESAFDPQALSRARASGMWQFMPGTGRSFELKQNVFRDDRRDILASTRAALDYLEKLYGMFGDWHLALAAYNWGEGNVQRAVQRNQRRGLAADYTSITTMPAETRNYVPKLQAIKNIVARPADFSLTLPPLQNHPHFVTVALLRDIDVALAAKLAGLTTEQFQQLNPQFEKPLILAAGTPRVLLPYDAANDFVRNIESHVGPLASWTAWVAPKTMKPADAARHTGMSEADLRSVNQIPTRMLVKAGSTLLVTRNGKHAHDITEQMAQNGTIAFAPEFVAKGKAAHRPAHRAARPTRAGQPAVRAAAPRAASIAKHAAKPAPRLAAKPRTRIAAR